jgi:ferritin-like metal-binding protein YciE
MAGLVEEGKEMMGEDMDEETMDAALISIAQKVEHYEIASYGTVRTWANLLGDEQTAKLLQQTLDEEGKTDKLLTQMAEESINIEAAQPN